MVNVPYIKGLGESVKNTYKKYGIQVFFKGGKIGTWQMVNGGIMCIPNRFTAPRGSLVACMFPRELRWEEVAPPHKRNDTVLGLSWGNNNVPCEALQE